MCLLIWGDGSEKEEERGIDRLPPVPAWSEDCTHLGQGSNLQPFGVWDDAPAQRATQADLDTFLKALLRSTLAHSMIINIFAIVNTI